MKTEDRLFFASDYMEGAHERIIEKLVQSNLEKSAGYGQDSYTESAKNRIRAACGSPQAEVYLLAGGTQTNETVITAMLRPYQGVLAAETGHIATHEAGAIEAGGHKVLTLPQKCGKVSAWQIEQAVRSYRSDENREHTVMPGMVYISHPTEYGTLYSLEELTEISRACRENGIALYLDGARLAYAVACPENDVSLSDIARLCDAFYIGGTKCGALFGEAVVFPKPETVPHFFSIVKQRGALLAKGRIAGIQFDVLFTDGLYEKIGRSAIAAADRIRETLKRCGYELCFGSPTNQVFCVMDGKELEALSERVEYSFWEKRDDGRTVIRLATSWATTVEDTDALIAVLEGIKKR